MKLKKGALLLALLVVAPYLVTNTEEAVAPASPATPSQTDALACGLQHQSYDQDQQCGSDALPDRLRELIDGPKVSAEFRKAAESSNFSALEPTVIAETPVLILIHLGPKFLASSSSRGLSAVVRKHPKDPVVARTILSALDEADDEKRVAFIRELGMNSGMNAEVQAAIGEAAVRWWGHDLSKHSVDLAAAGTPLLAALPPGYLAELEPEQAADMLMQLRNHHWQERNDPRWSEQPPETKRVWMDMLKKDPDSGKGQLVNTASDGLKMLWAGATPDEINDLQFERDDRATLTALSRLSKLQVRAFLDKLYTQKALSSMEMNDIFKWMLDLAPAGLQRFLANDTDFTSLPAADTSRASLPTLKQVLEQVVASSLFQGRIHTADHPGTWGRAIKDVGRLAYLIRATHLSNYSLSTHRLPVDVLAAIDTYKLSAMQARYLTNKGAFLDLRQPPRVLEGFHGLTRAMPTSRLAALRMNSVSNDVMLHFLESIPATHSGRSATLFNKMRSSMTESKVLEATLRNPEPAQYWSLISARELAADRAALELAYGQLKAPMSRSRTSAFTLGDWIESTLKLSAREGIENHLSHVPLDKLSALLGSARRELSEAPSGPRRIVWSTDTLLSPDRPLVHDALLGLTCSDVVAMELVDFPVIMAEFNRRLRAAGRPFPKRLQYCMQRAMEDYMDMRRRIRRFSDKEPLVAVLEPSDIEAIGGYVLSTLRPKHIHHSRHAVQILSAIGALPPQELLAAVPNMERLRELALQLVDIFRARRAVGARCLFALGNLHMFLPADVIYAIDSDSWKLFVEAAAGRPRSLAMCAGSEQRDAWHRLAVRSFGSPSYWTPGVVAALGDTLAALPADVLASVRVTSWRDAADTLSSRTLYHLPCDVAGTERPQPFVDVCRSLLPTEERSAYYWNVRRAARFYLRASQNLMDTVMGADSLFRRLQSRSSRTHFRNASPSSSTTASTTATPTTTTEAETTPASTTSTSTTTTEDPFGNFDEFLSVTPSWMKEAPPLPPNTVMVVDDETSLSTSTTAATTTTTRAATESTSESSSSASSNLPSDQTATPSTAVDKEMFEPWDETSTTVMSPLTSTSTAETTTLVTSGPGDKVDFRSALTLPPLPARSLAMYPNQSNGSPGQQLNLSETTTKYSVELEDREKADVTNVDQSLEKNRRRRRSTGADVDWIAELEAENERQVERNVLLKNLIDMVIGANSLVRRFQSRSSRTHYRNAFPSSPTITPTTATPTTTEAETTPASTTSRSTEDPFGSFDEFLSVTPSWMKEAPPLPPHTSESRRWRRSTDADVDPNAEVEAENERQVERDVPLQVTCDAIRALGRASVLALVRSDAEHMRDVEAEDCIEELSTLDLGPQLTRDLWTMIPKDERADLVADLGRFVSALAVDEVPQLNLSLAHERALDTLSVIGAHVTDPVVLDAVAAQLEQQNPKLRSVAGSAAELRHDVPPAEPQPDSLLVALGPLACHLQLDLQRLLLSRQGALLHAAHSLQGVALHCNATCLGELARAAVSGAALGAPANWTAEDVRDMGVIVAGLPTDQLSHLQRPLVPDQVEQPLSGLTASAVSCMSPEQVQAIGDYAGVLSPVAASAVSQLQQQDMTADQQASLLRVRNLAFTRTLGKSVHDDEGYPVTDSSSRQQPHAALLLSLLILVAAF